MKKVFLLSLVFVISFFSCELDDVPNVNITKEHTALIQPCDVSYGLLFVASCSFYGDKLPKKTFPKSDLGIISNIECI